MLSPLDPALCFPQDLPRATLIARVWVPGSGPHVACVRSEGTFDLSAAASTVSALLDLEDPVAATQLHWGQRLGDSAAILRNSAFATRDANLPYFLAPCDLQALKATGVTFVNSVLERVIEEQARGDAAKAESVRRAVVAVMGDNLSQVKPGSEQAAQLKAVLLAQGAWSQYLEVAIGPDAEVFTKSAPMSAVGVGAQVGIHPRSHWNNPEPEIVLAVNSRAQVVGASLGNDVNLRDFEGRSALLLGKAKDNNASCAIGPFVRLFDAHYGMDEVRASELTLEVRGAGDFFMRGSSSMSQISRDPLDLVRHVMGNTHQYPDGLMFFLGTMFAPTQDRHGPGLGFTHEIGDVVTVSTPTLGALINTVNTSDQITPWTYGVRALMADLARR